MTEMCTHCKVRPVVDKPNAKVCHPCFLFAMASLLDKDHVIPEELNGLTIADAADIFGDTWDDFALKCWIAVLPCFTKMPAEKEEQ